MNEQAIKNCKSILKRNHLHPIRKLGKGAFATVFLVEKIQLQKNQNQLYSVKCINKKQIIKRPSLNKYIKQEIQILRNIQHENIVRSFRTFEDQGWIFMVMEYCDKGNLNTKVAESSGNVLSLEETFHISWDIVKGLEYMHRKNLIHRDIKAENILLSSKKQIKSQKSKKSINPSSTTSISSTSKYEYITKICDLGFTRQEDESVNTFCGTTCYMAPQIFKKLNYDNKVDIWALGVLMFYMLFGDFPFKGMNVEFEIEKKCSQGFKISNVTSIKPNQTISKVDLKVLDDFFRKIFMVNPDERMSLQELKSYPWFKKLRSYSDELPSSTNLSQKVIKGKLYEHRSSEKTTIQSDSSSENPLNSPKYKQRNTEIEKYYFLKEIIGEVQKQKFLKSIQELAFKYYILKMLHCEFAKTLEKAGKSEYRRELQSLASSLDKHTNLMANNLSKLTIQKFQPQHFNPKAKQFSDFKEAYRLVIGHVFAKAHKNITEDIHIRSQLKLKLFICHVINRVFDKEHNEGIFVHFDNYSKKVFSRQKITSNFSKDFSFRLFRKWIQTEQPERLVETVQLMNSKYYKGK